MSDAAKPYYAPVSNYRKLLGQAQRAWFDARLWAAKRLLGANQIMVGFKFQRGISIEVSGSGGTVVAQCYMGVDSSEADIRMHT